MSSYYFFSQFLNVENHVFKKNNKKKTGTPREYVHKHTNTFI